MKQFACLLVAVVFAFVAPDRGARCDEARDELAGLLARARAASGVEAFRAKAGGHDLLLHGHAKRFGVAGDWTLRLAADGSFVRDVTGELPGRDGCDGAHGNVAWSVDATGMPVAAALALREHLLLETGVEFGGWCLEGGPILVLGMKPPSATSSAAPAAGADGEVRTLRLRAKDGVLEVELDVDVKSALPRALRWNAAGAPERWRCAGWRAVGGAVGAGGLLVPESFEMDESGIQFDFELERGELDAAAPAAAFAVPTARPADTTFDSAVASRPVFKRARTGHLLVKAKLGGQDLGWVDFDSCSGDSCLAPHAVDALRLTRFGATQVGGAGAARAACRFARGAPLEIGPVRIDGLVWTEFDLGGLEEGLGEKLAGVVGYDLLQRVVAVADMKSGAVDFFDPKSFARAGVVWSPLILHVNHPHVRATFDRDGEEEGLFRLDTGAPGVTILFHSPAVRALGLLDGDFAPPLQGIAGVGGQMRARTGVLDQVKIGGRSFDHPRVIFCEDESGAMADPWTAGTMGGGILDEFDVIFDYPHARVGFVAHAPVK